MPKKYKTRAQPLKTNSTENTRESGKKDQKNEYLPLLIKNIKNPLWLSVSEAAKLGGVQTKTIRRAIKSNHIRYRIIGNRYSVDFSSLIYFLHTKTKLKNKLNQLGLGQYIKEWEK